MAPGSREATRSGGEHRGEHQGSWGPIIGERVVRGKGASLGCRAKERPAPYRPGPRAPEWLNVKPHPRRIVTSGSTTGIAGGAQRRAAP